MAFLDLGSLIGKMGHDTMQIHKIHPFDNCLLEVQMFELFRFGDGGGVANMKPSTWGLHFGWEERQVEELKTDDMQRAK